MPKNSEKTHCQIPGCRSWAMRGHTRCRAHRDAELGPRGAGAPPGNLNALRHAAYSQPLSKTDLHRLAAQIFTAPADLPLHIGQTILTLQSRTGDTFRVLLALTALCDQLLSHVAGYLFPAELHTFLQNLPPAQRYRVRVLIQERTARLSPAEKILFLRKIQNRKTITGTGRR